MADRCVGLETTREWMKKKNKLSQTKKLLKGRQHKTWIQRVQEIGTAREKIAEMRGLTINQKITHFDAL